MKPFPYITAHTGCMGAPDNTEESARLGIAHGADIVEDDIRATRDGVLVLSHDDNVRLADGTEGSVSAMTLEELNARMDRPLQLLEPVLKLIADAGKMMNLDIKSDDSLAPVSRLVEKLGLRDRVFLTGCEYPRAAAVAEIDPRLRKMLNIDYRSFMETPYPEAVNQICRQALDAGCFGLNLPYQVVRPLLMDAARDAGLEVYVWTVNDEPLMRLMAEMGVRSITTRRVDVLARLKRNWSLEDENAAEH